MKKQNISYVYVCDKCGSEKDVSSFPMRVVEQDGHGKNDYYLKSIELCSMCQNVAYEILKEYIEK